VRGCYCCSTGGCSVAGASSVAGRGCYCCSTGGCTVAGVSSVAGRGCGSSPDVCTGVGVSSVAGRGCSSECSKGEAEGGGSNWLTLGRGFDLRRNRRGVRGEGLGFRV
jgi:hypothetical protein